MEIVFKADQELPLYPLKNPTTPDCYLFMLDQDTTTPDCYPFMLDQDINSFKSSFKRRKLDDESQLQKKKLKCDSVSTTNNNFRPLLFYATRKNYMLKNKLYHHICKYCNNEKHDENSDNKKLVSEFKEIMRRFY